MEANVFAIGHLGKNAEVKKFNNGHAVIQFSIASNSYYFDKDGEKVQTSTWHECKRFVKKVNEKLIEKLLKGQRVSVFGLLKYDEYEKSISKTKSIPVKRCYIDIKELNIS